MASQLLLVNPVPSERTPLVESLTSDGFVVTAASTFEEATALLKSHSFAAVVTAHRLGAHNGLHLILRARAEQPLVLGIVTTAAADPVLVAEAAVFGAVCLVSPWEDSATVVALLRQGAWAV